MRLDEWRALLQVDDRKSRGPDDFWALCPCHSDHEASLHVTIGGDGGVRMKCFVCDAGNVEVARALGKTAADVMCDARTGEDLGRGGARAAKPKRAEKAKKPVPPFREGEVWRLGKGRDTPYTLTRIYSYADEDGVVRLQKARFEHAREDGGKDKYFSFRSLGGDGLWYATAGAHGDLLYRLPDVKAAMRAGKTIYVVEGEKDADNLAALGYCATSSAYGAGKGKLEGKWLPAYTEQLRGAGRVIVIPDNDAAGEAMAAYVCTRIHDAVGELRVLRLAQSLTGADAAQFDKGDFSDWAQLRRRAGKGRREICAEFDALSAAAPVFVPTAADKPKASDAEDEEGEDGDSGEPYYGLSAYSIKWERLCKVDPKWGPTILCDFVPHPLATVTRDDGAQVRTEYVIAATYKGETLPDAHVSSDEFEAMRWPGAAWQFRGNIRPTRGAREYVRDAIMRAGQRAATRRTVYEHTGMRIVDGRACYLYNGGAIGAQGVSVELENNLRYYTLDVPPGVTRADGVRALTALMAGVPERIILPLLAQAFLAPVYSAMEAIEDPPAYVVYLVGRTGSYKSTLVGYIESCFGSFYLRRHTASFQETANQVRDKAFYSKDALFVVDDYNPETDARRRSQMDAIAQAVITAVADRAERGGLTADRRMRKERPARCTCIMTGEQLPNLNQGRMLRLYVVDIGRGEIATDTAMLDVYKQDAVACRYRAAMRGYIETLLSRWDGIETELRARIGEAQRIVQADKALPRDHARMLSAGVHLMVGCGLMIDYLIGEGAYERDMRAAWLETCWRAIRANILSQERTIEEASPVHIYLEAVRSLIRMRSVRVVDLAEPTAGSGYAGPGLVGYKDSEMYYFEPAALDRAVRVSLKDRGIDLGPSAATIRRMMLEQGVCMGDGVSPCRKKTIRGTQQRMLWIPRETIDGQPDAETIRGFTPVHEQVPFELRRTDDDGHDGAPRGDREPD